MKNGTLLGTLDIEAGTITNRSYETASWWTTFEHEAQTVEVRSAGSFVVWGIEGRTTHEHFPSSFGGVQYGGGTMGPCDRPGRHGVQIYGYEAAKLAESGVLKLADDVEVVESFYDHPVSCSGYSYEGVEGRAVPVACECELHEDAHGRPTIAERGARGFLPFGYVPGVKDRKRHIEIVEKTAVSS